MSKTNPRKESFRIVSGKTGVEYRYHRKYHMAKKRCQEAAKMMGGIWQVWHRTGMLVAEYDGDELKARVKEIVQEQEK